MRRCGFHKAQNSLKMTTILLKEILIKPVNEVQQWCFGMLKDLNDAADSTSSSPAMLKFGHKELFSGEFLDLMVLRMVLDLLIEYMCVVLLVG